MKSVTVAKLKATLSEYLARVKAGEEVIVTERGKPIARIVPLARDQAAVPAHLLELARAGLVRLGSGKLPERFWRMSRPADPRGAGLKALLEKRRGLVGNADRMLLRLRKAATRRDSHTRPGEPGPRGRGAPGRRVDRDAARPPDPRPGRTRPSPAPVARGGRSATCRGTAVGRWPGGPSRLRLPRPATPGSRIARRLSGVAGARLKASRKR